jgi:hypothetical protein
MAEVCGLIAARCVMKRATMRLQQFALVVLLGLPVAAALYAQSIGVGIAGGNSPTTATTTSASSGWNIGVVLRW